MELQVLCICDMFNSMKQKYKAQSISKETLTLKQEEFVYEYSSFPIISISICSYNTNIT